MYFDFVFIFIHNNYVRVISTLYNFVKGISDYPLYETPFLLFHIYIICVYFYAGSANRKVRIAH